MGSRPTSVGLPQQSCLAERSCPRSLMQVPGRPIQPFRRSDQDFPDASATAQPSPARGMVARAPRNPAIAKAKLSGGASCDGHPLAGALMEGLVDHWLLVTLSVLVAALGATAFFTITQARAAERKTPPIGRFLEVDGVRLHYLEQGQGDPVVLIHG